MTEEERIIHVWNKNKLLEEGSIKEYSKYKLKPYKNILMKYSTLHQFYKYII